MRRILKCAAILVVTKLQETFYTLATKMVPPGGEIKNPAHRSNNKFYPLSHAKIIFGYL